jgi:hypothetical protein
LVVKVALGTALLLEPSDVVRLLLPEELPLPRRRVVGELVPA